MRRWWTMVVVVALLALGATGYGNARADPVVRRATIALPDWPEGAPPVTLALVADIHMANPAMDRARLERIVAQIDRLEPDIIVIAGDLIDGSGADRARRAIPMLVPALRALKAPLGVIAVPGNHDTRIAPADLKAALEKSGITTLSNNAVVRGPLVLGGVGDWRDGRGSAVLAARAMAPLPGANVLIAHTPDVALHAPPEISLVLAGHTHCGQIVFPVIGAPISAADPRYRCGLIRARGRTLVVTGGLGTSKIPMRFGAPPDLWLLTLKAAAVSGKHKNRS